MSGAPSLSDEIPYVFGDGSLWALSTPGHTKGHVSYVVNGVGKQALITGDCSISKQGFELGIESGNHSADLTEGRKSFLKLKEFADRYPFLKVLFGHETDEFHIDY